MKSTHLSIFFILLLSFWRQISVHAADDAMYSVQRLLDLSARQLAGNEQLKALGSAQKSLLEAKLKQWDEGVGRANVAMAKALASVGLHSEALRRLADAEKTIFFRNSIDMQLETANQRGNIYFFLNAYPQALAAYQEQATLTEEIKNNLKKDSTKLKVSRNLVKLYDAIDDDERLEQELLLQEEILNTYDDKNVALRKDRLAYFSLSAQRAIIALELDLAKSCLDQAMRLTESMQLPDKHELLTLYGDWYYAKTAMPEAENYYQEALANALSNNNSLAVRDITKKMYTFYASDAQYTDSAQYYFQRFNELRDSLSQQRNKTINLALEQVLHYNNIDHKVLSWRFVIWGFAIVFIILLIFVLIKLLPRRRKNNNLTETVVYVDEKPEMEIQKLEVVVEDEPEIVVEDEPEIVVEDEPEIVVPQKPKEINAADLSELMILAKEGRAEFLLKFENTYPEFIASLRELDPQMRNNEMMFCALNYLNFSAKEIASFTFVTVRAVQMRKNRMRKKLGIDSDVDFNVWMRNLENKEA